MPVETTAIVSHPPTIIDRSDDGLVLQRMPDNTFAWLRPEEACGRDDLTGEDGSEGVGGLLAPGVKAVSSPTLQMSDVEQDLTVAVPPAVVPLKEATPADLLRDPSRFLHWLEQQPDDVYVGEAGSARMCPLANFLQDAGFREPSVTEAAIYWHTPDNRRSVDHPRWSSFFVTMVDLDGRIMQDIRASHARALVELAVRETT